MMQFATSLTACALTRLLTIFLPLNRGVINIGTKKYAKKTSLGELFSDM